jgi:hypothetical protein
MGSGRIVGRAGSDARARKGLAPAAPRLWIYMLIFAIVAFVIALRPILDIARGGQVDRVHWVAVLIVEVILAVFGVKGWRTLKKDLDG